MSSAISYTPSGMVEQADRCINRMGLPYSPAKEADTPGYFAAPAHYGVDIMFRYPQARPTSRRLLEMRDNIAAKLESWGIYGERVSRAAYPALHIAYGMVHKWIRLLDDLEAKIESGDEIITAEELQERHRKARRELAAQRDGIRSKRPLKNPTFTAKAAYEALDQAVQRYLQETGD